MGTRKWNYAWHNQQIEAFRKEHPVYELYVSLLHNVLEEFCRRNIPESHTGGRAKGLPSFAEKAIRKVGKYPDPIHQFTDLAGARIVTLTRADADRACQFIRRVRKS